MRYRKRLISPIVSGPRVLHSLWSFASRDDLEAVEGWSRHSACLWTSPGKDRRNRPSHLFQPRSFRWLRLCSFAKRVVSSVFGSVDSPESSRSQRAKRFAPCSTPTNQSPYTPSATTRHSCRLTPHLKSKRNAHRVRRHHRPQRDAKPKTCVAPRRFLRRVFGCSKPNQEHTVCV